MAGIDIGILYFFNALAGLHPGLDWLLAAFSNYGPLLILVLLAAYFVRPAGAARTMRRTVLLSMIAAVLALAVRYAIGHLVYRARPSLVLSPEHLRLLVPHGAESSFPSGHAITASAVAGAMWQAPDAGARLWVTILAVLVALSRLVAGVHWPTDVFVSLILGALLGQLVYALRRPLTPALDWVIDLWERVEQALQRA